MAKLREQCPGMEHQECMRRVGEQWRQLSKEQRASWCFDPPAKDSQRSRKRGAEDGESHSSDSFNPSPSLTSSERPDAPRVSTQDTNNLDRYRMVHQYLPPLDKRARLSEGLTNAGQARWEVMSSGALPAPPTPSLLQAPAGGSLSGLTSLSSLVSLKAVSFSGK